VGQVSCRKRIVAAGKMDGIEIRLDGFQRGVDGIWKYEWGVKH
jgi:hypothetical protein